MLKFVALILMLIDHLGYSLFPNLLILRVIGRLSFPIFAYSLTEGYIYTKNRDKYFKRLLIFALISMIPYAFLFDGFTKFSTTIYVLSHTPIIMFIGHLDIGFTLSLGFISLMIIDRIKANRRNIFNYIGIILVLAIAKVIGVDYGIYGVLSIMIFYIFRGNKPLLILSFLLLPATMINPQHMSFDPIYQCFAVLSIPIILGLKDKELSKNIKVPRWFFYVFYPLHITILWIIRCL